MKLESITVINSGKRVHLVRSVDFSGNITDKILVNDNLLVLYMSDDTKMIQYTPQDNRRTE